MKKLRTQLYDNRWCLAIMVFSLLLKLSVLQRGEVINPDAVTYIAAAHKHANLLFQEGLHYYRMPFYPMLLASMHLLVPNWILAGQLLTIIPLTLSIWPLYGLTQRLFDRQSALCTALLFAVLPAFNNNSSEIMRDPLFLFFFLCALWCLVIAYQEHSAKAVAGVVLCMVLAILTRIEGVVLLPVVILAVGVSCWQHERRTRALLFTTVSMVAFAGVIGVIINSVEVGNSSLSFRLGEVITWAQQLLSLQFFHGYQNLLAETKKIQALFPGSNLHNNLFEVTRHYAPLLYLVGIAEMVIKAIFPTSLLAFAAWRWRQKVSAHQGRWLIVIVWLIALMLNLLFTFKRNFTTERYLWMVIVLSLPWIGYGMSLWWQQRSWRRGLATMIVAVMLIAPLVKTVVVVARPVDTTIISAGRWLRDYDAQRKHTIWYNDRCLALYVDRVKDVVNVRSLAHLRHAAIKNKRVDIVALYLSNKKNEDGTIAGFELLKQFQGEDKTVLLLQRSID